MFFWASKIIWVALSPLNLIFLLLIMAAGFFLLRFKKMARFSVGIALLLFVVIGVMPVGRLALVTLEAGYPRTAQIPEDITGIVVLGGFFETTLSESRGFPNLNDHADRIMTALELSAVHPDAFIVFSGGTGKLIPGQRNEADDIHAFLTGLGYPQDRVVYEEDSRNTYENLKFTMEFVMPKPDESWLLVTSAYHMPRSMAIATALGWDMIPCATDYKTDGSAFLLSRKLDVLGNFHLADLALREFAGMLAYRLTGKL